FSSNNWRATIGAFIDRIRCQASTSQLLQGTPIAGRTGEVAIPSSSSLQPDGSQGGVRKSGVLIPKLHPATGADFKRWRSTVVIGRARQVVISANRTTIELLLSDH